MFSKVFVPWVMGVVFGSSVFVFSDIGRVVKFFGSGDHPLLVLIILTFIINGIICGVIGIMKIIEDYNR